MPSSQQIYYIKELFRDETIYNYKLINVNKD